MKDNREEIKQQCKSQAFYFVKRGFGVDLWRWYKNMRAIKPTRKQKEFIAKIKLNYQNWLVVKEDESVLVIRHKDTGTERRIKKHGADN